MITDIPTGNEFHAAGLNQLYLAWQIAVQAAIEHESLADIALTDDIEEATAEYWAKSQPALANAFGLIQQAMEMALKGRIAAISPFLLISRDPKDWPRGVNKRAVPFTEFRTLDASDLVKVHNSFAAVSLDEEFQSFWEEVRRDRNKILHSVVSRQFDPTTLIRAILTAAQALFADRTWPLRLLKMEEEGALAAYGLSDAAQNQVMRQVEVALRHLTPAERKRLFGFESRRRAYLCGVCYERVDRDWQDEFPMLAQLKSRSPSKSHLHCIVCNETILVERNTCTNPKCKGTVIYANRCLTCVWEQDSPRDFSSRLRHSLRSGDRYGFTFRRPHEEVGDDGCFASDKDAIEHARRALSASHLKTWIRVSVYNESKRTRGEPWSKGELLGTWVRKPDGLRWDEGSDADLPVRDFGSSKRRNIS